MKIIERIKNRRLPIQVHCTPECGWSAVVPHTWAQKAVDFHESEDHGAQAAMNEELTTYFDEQQAIADKATEGPWERWYDQERIAGWDGMCVVGDAYDEDSDDSNPTARVYFEDDATFIAASRTAVPRLIEIARTQQAEIEQLRVYKEAWDDIVACGQCTDRSEVLDHFNELAREHGLPEAGE